MEASISNLYNISEAAENLFSYLDKGIDDMEAGKLHTVEDAFRIIGEKTGNEL